MSPESAAVVCELVSSFIGTAKEPLVIEPGQEPIPILLGCWQIWTEAGRIHFQAWSTDRNLLRRVTGIRSRSNSRLELEVERFGARKGTLDLVDSARPSAEKHTRRARRLTARELFRRALARHFPGWKLIELTCEPDLQRSLSPAYPRAFIRKGSTGWAAVFAPADSDVDGALTFGLIWIDYLRGREPGTAVEGLALFLPAGRERTSCHRIRHLDVNSARFRVFACAENHEYMVDIADAGNVDTQLAPRDLLPRIPAWLEPLCSQPGVELVECPGSISLRVRGLEFARCLLNGDLTFGVERRQHATAADAGEVASLVRYLLHARSAQNPDRGSRLYALAPERWLESCVRSHLNALDPRLLLSPVYTQAPSIAGSERGVMDLLVPSLDGVLTVVEVKASEDLHLPLQALDYWARVKWHLERGEFQARGYFPDMHLRVVPPRLLLVAPALRFHPATETVLRFFPSDMEVERAGVADGWRAELKVLFRARGSEAPGDKLATEENTHGERWTRVAGNSECTIEPES